MPRNNREIDAEEKREAILAVARRLFLEEGYESTTMARIAGEAGVAANTLYWYFDDKDALLIAILDGLVVDSLTEYEQVYEQPLQAQMLWLVERFEALRSLIATVHARVSVSDAVRTWHERFHAMVEAMMQERLRTHGVPPAERVLAAQVGMFVVEGLLAHSADANRRHEITRFVSNLITQVGQAGHAGQRGKKGVGSARTMR